MIYLFLAVVPLLAFWQVNRCDFVSFDDDAYITENDHIQTGLTMDAIKWAFHDLSCRELASPDMGITYGRHRGLRSQPSLGIIS